MRTSHLMLALGLTLAATTRTQDVLRVWRGQAGDGFGAALAALGDVDLDGHVDFAVGAPDRNGGVGAVDLLSAGGGLLRTLTGTTASEHFGQVLAVAGDVDRDGRTDLWVLSGTSLQAFSGRDGALLWRYPRTPLFAALGDYDGDGHDDVAFVNGADEVIVRSGRDGGLLARLPSTGMHFSLLAACGDVDGDGRPEVMTMRTSPTAPNTVDVWNLHSGASLFQRTRSDPGFGVQIGGAGDVDGDGRADFFVHDAQVVDPPIFSSNGVTYVYSGATLTELLRDTGVIYCYHSTCWRILRQQGYVAAPGDVNGDGVRERLGRYSLWGAAQVRVHHDRDDVLRLPGEAIVPAGDVDRDGIGDYALARNGEVWLVSAAAVLRQNFETPLYGYGNPVFGCYPCGDVDGDGRADFYVGRGFSSPPNPFQSSVTVCSGSDCHGLWTFTRNPTVVPLRILLATGGDLDRDGNLDIAVTGYDAHEISVFGGMRSNVPLLVIATDATAALALGADWNADRVTDVFCASNLALELRSGTDGSLFASLPFGARDLKLIGDVDGDGIADLLADDRIVGSRNRDVVRTLPNLPVAFIGDVNGDRRADAWTVNGDRLVLVSGFDGVALRDLPAPAGGAITSLAAGLDWNGDGWQDLLVGQPGWEGFGRAAVLSGLEGRLLHTEWGEAAGDEFGTVVGLLGQDAASLGGPALVAGAVHGGITRAGYGRWARANANPAGVNLHGTACGLGELRPQLAWLGGAPRLGGTFVLDTFGMNPGMPAVFMLALRDDSFGNLGLPADLRPFGMPGCVLHVGPELQIAAMASANGRVTLPLQVPDVAAVLGVRVFAQTLALEPRANLLGLLTSDAARIVLGR